MQLTFHEDAGHGWLEVPLKIVMKAKTDVRKLSRYSYCGMKGFEVIFYLEEDCDMPVFIEAARERGMLVRIKTQHHGNHCFVRELASLPDFAAEVAKLAE